MVVPMPRFSLVVWARRHTASLAVVDGVDQPVGGVAVLVSV